MIKQLKTRYGNESKYEFLCTSRNISVVQWQWYFSKVLNLFSWKDCVFLIKSFKEYDVVIDCEEYFRVSSLLALRLGKISVWYSNIFIRKVAYTYSYQYLENQHNLINCLWLIEKIGVSIKIPERMEPLVYQNKDTVKVNSFLQSLQWKTIICMHAWWAETSPDRFWDKQNWVSLIDCMTDKYANIHIVLSWWKFEESTNDL